VHPVVCTHPHTARKGLYVSKGECDGIEGMRQDEALALIEELADHIVDPGFRHIHRWREGDLLMWDNSACSISLRMTTNGRKPSADAPHYRGRHGAGRGPDRPRGECSGRL
jgi:hypothetical protein